MKTIYRDKYDDFGRNPKYEKIGEYIKLDGEKHYVLENTKNHNVVLPSESDLSRRYEKIEEKVDVESIIRREPDDFAEYFRQRILQSIKKSISDIKQSEKVKNILTAYIADLFANPSILGMGLEEMLDYAKKNINNVSIEKLSMWAYNAAVDGAIR